jgi:hypothetical protein
MTNQNEIKKIIGESLSEILEGKPIPKKNRLIEILGVILTPVVIASVSLFVTYKINTAQEFNAQMIAEARIESAKSIAEAQREHNAQIAEAELEVQRLNQIDDIFRNIIENGKDSPDPETKKMLIGSLIVHKETSLPFLVRIRDYFADYDGDLAALSGYAKKTIEAVLSNKHLDFEKMDFSSKGEPRILRYAKLQEYNLNGVKFDNCNLFYATFEKSSLSNASFINADLFGADFSETILNGANFDGANLRKAIFTGSKIEGADFEKAVNLEDASFSLSSILKNYEGKTPFEKVKNDTVLELLVQHIEELKIIGSENSELKRFLKRFEEIITYDRLMENLEERRAQRLASKNSELAPESVSGHS